MLLDDHEIPPRRPSPTEQTIKIILDIIGFSVMAMFSVYGLLRLLEDLTRQ